MGPHRGYKPHRQWNGSESERDSWQAGGLERNTALGRSLIALVHQSWPASVKHTPSPCGSSVGSSTVESGGGIPPFLPSPLIPHRFLTSHGVSILSPHLPYATCASAFALPSTSAVPPSITASGLASPFVVFPPSSPSRCSPVQKHAGIGEGKRFVPRSAFEAANSRDFGLFSFKTCQVLFHQHSLLVACVCAPTPTPSCRLSAVHCDSSGRAPVREQARASM